MKVASYHGVNDIRYEDMPALSPGPGELLVKVRACGLCGTDISKMREGIIPTPVVLGHEVAGDIAGKGEGADGFNPGDRVVVSHHLPCFVCRFCRRGSHSQCDEFKAQNIAPGGFSEYIIVKSNAVKKATFRIPDKISYEEACFTEPLACCLRAYERCGVRIGDTVMIIGMGSVGLGHLQMARLFGAGKTIAADRIDSRLALAVKFGADLTLNVDRDDIRKEVGEFTGSRGADAVIVAAGGVVALQESFGVVSRGGKIVVFAGCPPDTTLKINPEIIYHSEITLIGSYSSTPAEQAAALELISAGKINVRDLITHRFKLSELGKAVETAIEARDSLKIIISG